jgi:CPA2 family monovalent cation:H+ antiporter-2
LSVTPLGEFSFIIAQLGVTAGALPQKFQVLAVGVSLLTTLAGPLLIRRAEGISGWLADRQPGWLGVWEDYYQHWLKRLQQRERKNVLWQLSKKRFTQIGLEILLVTGLLEFAEPILDHVREFLPASHSFPFGAELIFWSFLGLVALVPLVAIWRNTSALALVYAQVSTAGYAKGPKLAPVVETALKGGAGLMLALWLSALLPIGGMARWLPLAGLAAVIVGIVALRRRLVYWHSVLEVELQEMLHQGEKLPGTGTPWMAAHRDWNLGLTECVLPDLADCRGRSLGELTLRTSFGCTVAGLERQGVAVSNPTAATVLYPRDKILLLGDPRQLAAGKEFLRRTSVAAGGSTFDEVRMEAVPLAEASRVVGRTLAELALGRNYGLQVAGISRAGVRLVNPGGEEKLLAGDDVLVLGSPDQIAAFKVSLSERREED